jgi:hypothetical protein
VNIPFNCETELFTLTVADAVVVLESFDAVMV